MGVRKRWARFRKARTLSRIRCYAHCIVALSTLAAAGGVVILDMKSLLSEYLHDDIIDSISYTPSAILLGAILAVTLHYLADLLAISLVASSLDEIPEGFYHAAAKEVVEDIRYYRTNAKVYIGPIRQEKSKRKLEVVLSSVIVGMEDSDMEMMHSKFAPATGGSSIDPEVHIKIDNKECNNNETIRIRKGDRKPEHVNVYHHLEEDKSCFSDRHIWLSPVSGGFSVHFRLPEYTCNAFILRGTKERRIDDQRVEDENVIFSYHEALFSNQGFSWSIEKKKI